MTLNIFYVVLFSAAIFYVYRNRAKATFRTRSPRLIMSGYFLMMMDCVCNTIALTKNTLNVDKFTFQCDFHICTTVLVYFSMMAVYFVRMWRVYKVFGLYQKYLDQQQANNQQMISDTIDIDGALFESL